MSACGVSQDNDQATTTSPAAAEETINPWDLPIEQRPALFDPCAEIPIEAVEQGVGGPVEPSEQLHNHRPGELFSCGWKNDEVLIDILSTWKSHSDYIASPTGFIDRPETKVLNRSAMRLTDRFDDPETCRYLFFTDLGTVVVSVSLTTTLGLFRGQRFTRVCEALNETTHSLLQFIPNGDFR